MKIQKIVGREILDSRGNPTVEVDVVLENHPELKEYYEYVNLGVASEQSLEAIDAALSGKSFILHGPPGTGKR